VGQAIVPAWDVPQRRTALGLVGHARRIRHRALFSLANPYETSAPHSKIGKQGRRFRPDHLARHQGPFPQALAKQPPGSPAKNRIIPQDIHQDIRVDGRDHPSPRISAINTSVGRVSLRHPRTASTGSRRTTLTATSMPRSARNSSTVLGVIPSRSRTALGHESILYHYSPPPHGFHALFLAGQWLYLIEPRESSIALKKRLKTEPLRSRVYGEILRGTYAPRFGIPHK